MISITNYLENIYEDFKDEIDTGKCLCELKDLRFDSNSIPDYSNVQIQRLYLLRYAFAYGFEYSCIYSKALSRLGNPTNVSVASIGCGNYLDYWSLVKTIEEKKKINCSVRYVGIDQIDWNYKFEKRPQDELIFNKGDAVQLFQKSKQFISDIYFFPKSISEFSNAEMKIITDNLKSKPIIKDKIILCFSIRANEYSRDSDMAKTNQIIQAFEENGYRQDEERDTWWHFRENKGIIAFDGGFKFPQEAYDYVVNLNEKCYKYIENGINCKNECTAYLNRKPITKTGNITYQLIELERI